MSRVRGAFVLRRHVARHRTAQHSGVLTESTARCFGKVSYLPAVEMQPLGMKPRDHRFVC